MGAILCIGGAAIDLGLRLESPPILGTSNLATSAESYGGVARNVADLLARFGTEVALMTAVGDDSAGSTLVNEMRTRGIDMSRTIVAADQQTARYIAVLEPTGELLIGVNAMNVITQISPDAVRGTPVANIEWVFAECNLSATTIAETLDRFANQSGIKVAIDTISVPKSLRLPSKLDGVDVLFTNVDEANAILGTAERRDRKGGTRLATGLRQRGVAAAVVTLGDQGHVVETESGSWWSAAIPSSVVDVTGAGDALIAGTLAAIMRGYPIFEATREGALAAALTAESAHVAPENLNQDLMAESRSRLESTPMEGTHS